MAKKDNSQFDKANQEKPKLQPLISVKTFKSLQDIKNGDSFEEALRKLYLLMWENISTDREQQEIDGLFEEEAELNKARQHQQILEALFSLKEDKRSRQQKRQEERKETKKAEEPKKVEQPKAEVKKPTAEKVEKPPTPKTEPTVPKAEPVPQKAEVPKPSAEPAVPKAPSTKPSTMADAAVGAAAVTAIAGYEYAKNMIKRHEGVRTRPYKDSLGLWTIGVGHLIGDGKSLPKEWDREFTQKEVDDLYEQDFEEHKKAAEKIPGYNKLNEKGKSALIDLTFNMGPSWYKKWPNFTKQLESGDTEGAAKNLEGSVWYKQVGKRGPEVVDLLRGGDNASTTSTVPPTMNKGTQLSESSVENKDLKKPSAGGVTVINNTNNNIVKGGNQETVITNKPNDKPQLLQ